MAGCSKAVSGRHAMQVAADVFTADWGWRAGLLALVADFDATVLAQVLAVLPAAVNLLAGDHGFVGL